MRDFDHQEGRVTVAEKRWAIVRLILGQAQIIGATAAGYLLIREGVNNRSMVAVMITCAFTSISVLLFGSRQNRR
jgi:hypothetical protein